MMIAKGISKRFSRTLANTNVFYAVRETDFELPDGQLTVLEGRSGSGKTTLLNMMCGLLSPSTGTIYCKDTEISVMSDDEISAFRNKHFGIVPQGQSAVRSLTVFENIILPASIYERGRNVTDKAKELIERLGISELADVMPNELSGGEMRRMAIARALINEPDVIFADEPTSDLDDENTRLVFEIFKDIASEGKAVMIVTHEKEAENYADRMFRMNAGVLSEKA